jgi:hypothetical protein
MPVPEVSAPGLAEYIEWLRPYPDALFSLS